MNDLVGAVASWTSVYESSDSGEWVRFRCPRGGTRYVVKSRLADGYQAWCQHDGELKPEWHATAGQAVAGPARPGRPAATSSTRPQEEAQWAA